MLSSSRCEYWWDDTVKYGLSISAAPTLEPVTPEDVRDNAHIDLTDDDTWLLGRIQSARLLAEKYIKRAFIETTFRLTLDAFPSGAFYLPRPTLRSVTSVKYLDANGTQQTLSASNYTVDIYTEPGRIVPAYGLSWPTHRQDTNSIEVIYKAGYGTTAGSVPRSVRDAIIATVTQWYFNRGDDGDKPMSELPACAKTLLRCEAWGYLP